LLHVAAGNLYGGVERMLVTIRAAREGCPTLDHEFAVCHRGKLFEQLQSLDATVHELPAARVSRPWTVLAARRRLQALITHREIDTVLFHGCWPLALFGWRSAPSGCQSVLWAHDAIEGRHWVERLARRWKIDRIVANSRWVLERARSWRHDVPGRAICCPVQLPAEPLPRSGRVRNELGVDSDTVVIVQVGRLEAWKGHRRLIDAAHGLLRRGDLGTRWEIWIVGGPQRPAEIEYLNDLQRRAAELGPRVRFLGQRHDVPEVLADADLFCQPNESPEPLGIVFLEAMAQGLPVVSTDFGGAQELVPVGTDGAGLLTPPGDVAALQAALERLMTDAELRGRMSQVGPRVARRQADPAARLHDLARFLGGDET
jgi:glycosyltransferase involved in cell wall biosynthesis